MSEKQKKHIQKAACLRRLLSPAVSALIHHGLCRLSRYRIMPGPRLSVGLARNPCCA